MKNTIIEYLKNTTENELLEIYTEYCIRNYYTDDYIFGMDEFNEAMENEKPLKIAQLVTDESFNPNDKYFKFTMYGVYSFNTLQSEINFDDLSKDITIHQVEYKHFEDLYKLLTENEVA